MINEHVDFRLRKDKLMHLTFGAALAALGILFIWLGGPIAGIIVPSKVAYLMFGLEISVAGGILKEVYDWYHPKIHTWDVGDACYTALGGLIFILIIVAL